MVMDKSSNGIVGRATGIAAIVATVTFLLAGVGAFYSQIDGINRNLDRNLEAIKQTCLATRGLQADIRFHLAQEAASEPAHQDPPSDTLIAIDC